MTEPLDSTPDEIWKPIPNYETLYSISNYGRVKGNTSQGRREKRKPQIDWRGYWCILLTKEGKKKLWKLHRLVAMTFLDPVPEKHQINHKDGNPLNPWANNLEWCTQSENQFHAYNVLGRKAAYGESHGTAKLTDPDVLLMRKLHSSGVSNLHLARRFDIDASAVSLIVRGKRWKHLIPPASGISPSVVSQIPLEF